jgi:hypothetical protein
MARSKDRFPGVHSTTGSPRSGLHRSDYAHTSQRTAAQARNPARWHPSRLRLHHPPPPPPQHHPHRIPHPHTHPPAHHVPCTQRWTRSCTGRACPGSWRRAPRTARAAFCRPRGGTRPSGRTSRASTPPSALPPAACGCGTCDAAPAAPAPGLLGAPTAPPQWATSFCWQGGGRVAVTVAAATGTAAVTRQGVVEAWGGSGKGWNNGSRNASCMACCATVSAY